MKRGKEEKDPYAGLLEGPTHEDLLAHLEAQSDVFRNKAIKAAFTAVDRKDFVGADYHFEAYEDYPLPTLDGQTISQPTTVAFMLELLDPQEGDMILDIGAGSGWTTALLGHLVGSEGKVTGLEINPDLVQFGQKNINNKKYKKLPIEILKADKEIGYYKNAPYNRILGGAAFPEKTDALGELLLQLAPGGVMVIPIGDSIWKFEKADDEEFFETEYPGFNFVPYV